MLQADDSTAPRAGESLPGLGSLFTTDRAVAAVVLGALLVLVLVRSGFRGALGD